MFDPTTLAALVTGHLLGDFVLQTDALAELKTRSTGWLVLHVAVVSAVTGLLLGTVAAWPLVAALFMLHLVIDLTKRQWGPAGGESRRAGNPVAGVDGARYVPGDEARHEDSRGFAWFVADQFLHLAALIALAWAADAFLPGLAALNAWTLQWGGGYTRALILVSGFAATVWTLGVVLRYQMAEFAAGLPDEMVGGLPRAGRTVGRLERMLIFVFVLLGRPEAVGFVVAAKSVFRIGDLTRPAQRDHAEYIMIGTLRSFAYALILALATRWLAFL